MTALNPATLQAGMAVLELAHRAGFSIVQIIALRKAGVSDEVLITAMESSANVVQQYRDLDLRTN